MATEPNTGLTLSPAGPLQADLIVNPVIQRLGAVGGNTAGIQDKDLSTPPTLNSTTDVGKTYIIGGSPTGAWTGRANQIAYWNGVAWVFYIPAEGWRVAVLDEDTDYRFNGTTWVVQTNTAFSGGSLTSALNEAKGADIASAATTNIAAATGNFVHVTGTTTITALGTIQAGTRREVRFAGALVLTHNATSLILPTGANITTAANDCATFISEGSGNWRCVKYERADGTSLAGTPGAVTSVNGDTGAVIVAAPIIVACSDETTAISAGNGKVTFRMPYAFTVTAVRASLTTAQTSGSIFTVDINEGGSSILSTKITIDNTEKTSTTAVTPPVISDASLADDAEITIDVDQIGDATAKGLKVTLIGYAP